MTDHDDATRALDCDCVPGHRCDCRDYRPTAEDYDRGADAVHRAFCDPKHELVGDWDREMAAALRRRALGVAPLSVIEAGEALPLAVEALTTISKLSDATEQSSFREEAWAAMETLEPLAEAVRAALRADR